MDKKDLTRVILGALVFLVSFFLTGTAQIVVCLIAYVICGYETIIESARNIVHGQVFDENFLMTVASLGAIALGEYSEAIAVMLFYQIGELFEDAATDKSRKSIAALMDIRPEYANIIRDGGREEQVDPYDVAIGDIILVKPGERVPLDGMIVEGTSTVDTSAITGESVPVEKEAGDEIISGGINITGAVKVEVKSEFSDSTVSKILEMVEDASSRKAPVENFITKFARYYTPIVVGCAVVLALVPPLVTGGDFSTWVYRALVFLVVSCPCALVISVPLSFFGGIGAASRDGILVKGSNYMQVLAELETAVFDKTGTLTTGKFRVTKVVGDETLKIAAACEQFSNHPLALAVMEACHDHVPEAYDMKDIAGFGLKANVEGEDVYVGNARLMRDRGIEPPETSAATVIHVARGTEYIGYIEASDTIKPDAKDAISKLAAKGVKRIAILTGDNQQVADEVAKELGVSEVYGELLPQDKLTKFEEIISDEGTCAFTGDGINDAPSIARADIGIAMGAAGQAAAMEAADMVIMDDSPSKIAAAMSYAKKTLLIAKENIVFALTVKVILLILGALGLVGMWWAVFGDVGVMIIAILNAMRMLTYKP